MKEFSNFELQTIKRTAQMVNQLVTKKDKLEAKLKKAQEDFDSLQAQVDMFQDPIKHITGGYTTEDLIEKVIEDTGRTDKNGNPIKITKFEFIYPETILPPALDDVSEEGIDDTERAPEVEVKAGEESPINPLDFKDKEGIDEGEDKFPY